VNASTAWRDPSGDTRNWAGNVSYRARQVVHPSSLEEAQELVAGATTVHALGTKHSFSNCADSPDLLLRLDRIASPIEIDPVSSTVTIPGAARTGDFARVLDRAGFALHNTGSLPHISIAGAIATGTHGSGDTLGSLSSAVQAIELIRADGTLAWIDRNSPDFAGSIVAMGALGIVTRVRLAIEQTYRVRQDDYFDLPWASLTQHFDEITASAYSVSVFLRWSNDPVASVVLKSRDTSPPAELFGAKHSPPRPGTNSNLTEHGSWGPWWDRLPHFRLDAEPSIGDELQTEYFLPRASAIEALAEVGSLGSRIDEALHISELRTVRADDLWLSGAFGADVVSIHFTWKNRLDLVARLLPVLEERLLPHGARPHWGKLFAASGRDIRPAFARWNDFVALRRRVDPQQKFTNDYLDRLFGEQG